MHSFGIKKGQHFGGRTTIQPMDLSHPCTFQLEVAHPPNTHTLSEWAIIAPLISICGVLLMRGRPIDTLQKGGHQHYNRKEIYFLIIM